MAQRSATSLADQLKAPYGRHPLLEIRDIFSRQDKLMEASLRTLEEIRDLNRRIAASTGVTLPAISIQVQAPGEAPAIVGAQGPGAVTPGVLRGFVQPGTEKFESYFYDERGISGNNPSPRDIDVLSLIRRPATSGFIISDSQIITIEFNKSDKLLTLNPTEKFSLSPLDPFFATYMTMRTAAVSASIRIFLV